MKKILVALYHRYSLLNYNNDTSNNSTDNNTSYLRKTKVSTKDKIYITVNKYRMQADSEIYDMV